MDRNLDCPVFVGYRGEVHAYNVTPLEVAR